MKLKDLSLSEFSDLINNDGLGIDFGITSFCILTKIKSVQSTFKQLYADFEVKPKESFTDFQVSVAYPNNIRRFLKPQVSFYFDEHSPFLPLPKSQSYPLLEWGMNWCVAGHKHNYLLLHGAVLEKNGEAMIFPAPPGSGKSTLTAYLSHTGWRLLSDEMTVINLTTGLVEPFVRPICLKNNSIDLFHSWFPDAFISNIAKDTNKGDVAHVKPPIDSVNRYLEPAKVKAIVLPKYDKNVELDIYALNKCDAYKAVSTNAFNEGVMGKEGFESAVNLVESCDTVEIHYNNLALVSEFLLEGQFKP
ncbi:HprK-related kinase A [Paraglaciecola aquimarina]|uniref:HprK-related kinase A n=1 Tax=Paraglaciecola algarum TaxID=3050085 RepID=A0ABS9D457_9ALTE|nr:HprK-related kinase A [Paraglaciecola sp. G1-23]MCF2947727.1 HprK-related kinase A [Paraglaciecola sp. G1-23]